MAAGELLDWQSWKGQAKAKPVGEVVSKQSEGSGSEVVKFYSAFELAGKKYELENSVLVSSHPEDECKRPYVAIIKKIKEKEDECLHLLFQWLYRPEEAKNSFGGIFASADAREVYYSYHVDEFPAETVMHKCVVHFIPDGKQFPQKSKFPGHVVRRIYDRGGKRLWKLTDKRYKESNQEEIQKLLAKTRLVVGDLPDEVQESDPAATTADRRRKLTLLAKQEDVGVRAAAEQQQHQPLQKSPRNVPNLPRKEGVPASSNAPTNRDEARSRCRDQLFQALLLVCKGQGHEAKGKRQPMGGRDSKSEMRDSRAAADHSGSVESGASLLSPDPEAALVAANALESCVYDALSSSQHKYNLKIRSLEFNLRNNHVLARRLLMKELPPASVLHMTPAELKAGYTSAEEAAKKSKPAEKIATKPIGKPQPTKGNSKLQMTDKPPAELKAGLTSSKDIAKKPKPAEEIARKPISKPQPNKLKGKLQLPDKSPAELKAGVTPAGDTAKKPNLKPAGEFARMPPRPQLTTLKGKLKVTDMRCPTCGIRQVGKKETSMVVGETRCQMECYACEHNWVASCVAKN